MLTYRPDMQQFRNSHSSPRIFQFPAAVQTLRRTRSPACLHSVRCAAAATDTPKQVVVVGGGVGGLAVAGRMAKAGCSVSLLEKNECIGGRMQSIHLDEWRFDTGPSLLLFPQKYGETFAALGAPLSERVELLRVQPAAYRVHFPATPSFRVDLINDADAMAAQLEALEPGAGNGYREFLKMARNHLELGVPFFIDRDFTELQDAKGLLDLLPQIPNINPWRLLGPHDMVMRGFFKDQRLRAAFTFQDLYVGLSPGSAPAVFSLLAGTELTDGVWYPKGGFAAIRDALAEAAQACGVKIQTNVEVAAIEVDAAGEIAGVSTSNGDFIPADVVVCNRDLPAAYPLIRAPEAAEDITGHLRQKTERLKKLDYSNGVIAFNWCVRGELPELLHHNVFLSEQFEKAWRPAAAPEEFARYPNFYCHVPNRTDPTAAPPGCESVMVLLPVANMQRRSSDDYDALVEEGRRRVLGAFMDAGVGDVAPMIEKELVYTPQQYGVQYGLQYGAAFGLSHGLGQLSLFRPGNKEDSVKGLYFVGAGTRPGNGVPLCFIGAKLTAERVLKDWAKEEELQ